MTCLIIKRGVTKKGMTSALALSAALCVGIRGGSAASAQRPPAAFVEQPANGAKLLATFHSGLVQFCTVAFTPDGMRVVVSNERGATLTWDIARRRRVALHSAPVRRPEYANYNPHALPPLITSPDGRARVTIPSDRRVVLTNRATGRRRVFAVQNGAVQAIAFTPDSRRLLVAAFTQSGERQDDGQSVIHVLDVATGRLARIVKAGDFRLDAFAFSHRGTLLATRSSHWFGEPAHGTDVVQVWDTRTWTRRYCYPTGDQIWQIQFAGSDRTLLAMCYDWMRSDYHLNKYDMSGGQSSEVSAYNTGEASSFASVELSQDGTLLVSTKEGHAKCQDVATGRSLALFNIERQYSSKTSQGIVYETTNDTIAISPNNRLLADVDERGTVTLWQMPPVSAWRKATGK